MTGFSAFWSLLGFTSHLAAAALCALAVVWIVRQPVTKRADRTPTVIALVLTAAWAGVVAAFGESSEPADFAQTARNLAWILVLYRLFNHDGRDVSMAAIRPVVVALAFVEVLQLALLFIGVNWAVTPELVEATSRTAVMFHVLVAIGSLVLLHNLYGGAARETRDALRWSAAGLAGFWAFELNYYVVAYLAGSPSQEFGAMRGIVAALMAIPLAVGATNSLAGRRLQASHSVTFQTLSLLLIGGYLIAMFGAAQMLSLMGGQIGRLAQIGFLVAAATVTMLWLPSERLRGWLRVTVLKHLFKHRYDYREEWMRFTQTIGRSNGGDTSLYERAAQSIANILDSPAGLLFLPDEDGVLREASNWKWPGEGRELFELPGNVCNALERNEYILDLDDFRAGKLDGSYPVPRALAADPQAWVLVPLLHYERLTGAILLARPNVPRPLDWEDFDLLRVVARQLASYLAEHESHGALMEAAKFDDFNRRMAFVMHDIKNLASQLSLLSRNAEKHAENPEFRKDMLVTLRSGSDKLNQLLARLGRYGTSSGGAMTRIDLKDLAKSIAGRFAPEQGVAITRLEPVHVLADREALEQALLHLIQNAVDASAPGMPINLDVSSDGLMARIEIIDSGEGMDPEFVRHRLFKPFVSSKDGGFGIGAFESRELIRAMGGRLDVQSRRNIGTRFTISLPLAEAAHFLNNSTKAEAV